MRDLKICYMYARILNSFSLKNQHLVVRGLSTRKSVKAPSYYHHVGKQPLLYRTLGQQLEISASKYNHEAVVSYHEDLRYTFPELIQEVDRLAAGFLKLGLEPGDNVAIWGPNNMFWYLSMWAATRAGIVSVGINPAFQTLETEYCLKKMNCRAIIMPETFKTQNYYEILKRICPELPDSTVGLISSKNLPHLRSVIVDTKTKLKGTINFEDVLGLSSGSEIGDIANRQHLISPDSTCNVQFTSGTTSQPKAVLLSHYNFLNNAFNLGARSQIANQRYCMQTPFFHAYAGVLVVATMVHGATLVMPSASFSAKSSLQAIVDENCTQINGTPTMYVDLVRVQKEENLPLKTLKYAYTGGATCSPQLFLDTKQTLGAEHVRTVYGMTETSPCTFQTMDGDSMDQVLNTVGYVHDHIEVKIIDSEGNTVPFGEPGELCVRGYVTMLGYHDDEKKTKEILGRDKWLRTGDQFILQEDGYGRIVGRLKELIIRGGENIYPKEIEDFLHTHPDILEAYVVGVPDERMGEEICAYVRLQNGVSDLSREQIKDFSKNKISHFKVPRYLEVVTDFPKTTSGKIQKFKLQKLFEEKYLKNK